MTLDFTPLTNAIQCHEYDVLAPFFINRRNFYFGFKCFKVLDYFVYRVQGHISDLCAVLNHGS